MYRTPRLVAYALVLAAAGIGIGYLIWGLSGSLPTQTPITHITSPPPDPEPEQPVELPIGWSGRIGPSDDRRADAFLFSNTQDTILNIGCFTDRPDPTVRMRFQYDPFRGEEVGYSLKQRWAFYTGTEPVLSADHIREITAEQVDALLGAETLIYEAHADRQPDPDAALETSLEGSRWEGENEWQQPPAVYLHRGVFDLTVNREVLVAVLERCYDRDAG